MFGKLTTIKPSFLRNCFSFFNNVSGLFKCSKTSPKRMASKLSFLNGNVISSTFPTKTFSQNFSACFPFSGSISIAVTLQPFCLSLSETKPGPEPTSKTFLSLPVSLTTLWCEFPRFSSNPSIQLPPIKYFRKVFPAFAILIASLGCFIT